jgi:hypothetical protein
MLWGREGVVFPDRYFHRVVRKVHELRRLVRYVLQNARRHGARVPELERFGGKYGTL